uniref:Uncharacterized protein n=1 Tax=Tanacetum cinerariifolium TaxID=118510 RepID=A0A6L2MLX2_TANCI|nr:hypothetical protein [Tanacetum cinerariifolium]
MDLKLKLLNRIHLNKSNDTHTTHQQLYGTLYESIILNQDARDAQTAQLSFHKRSHNNQDPPNNRKGKNKKKCQKDVDKPSSRSSRRNRSLVVILQDDIPIMQPLEKADTLNQKHFNPELFPKKSGLAKRRMTCFDLFLKSDIDKGENHILGPSTVTIAKWVLVLGGEEVVGIMGPLYAFPLRVVIPFKSSFGLVMVLLGRVLEPEDKESQLAVEKSWLDELELGNPGLDKPVLDKLEVGFDHN